MPDWDARYAVASPAATPAQVLREFAHLLPSGGVALDLACGLGANARLLARHGLDAVAWDRSTVAIERLRAAAAGEGLRIRAEVRDVLRAPPPANAFDVIVVSRFLARELAPALRAALRPGGLLFYQTFVRQAPDPQRGPRSEAYRLAPNELLALFSGLRLVAYREETTLGDLTQGLRDEAYAIFQREDTPT
ncbi:class I SAM-dependent methyltransferase [Acidihalobacter ferrooxydans]|uniref:SAM-dependent methyltransferase n=1 Tax=Acidihalobacter ferrooxydans TaxID=1765967 RepID=A0A1P8UKM1_9GAMM|nr:class I SAM-dependent methyltransferase [Acidihalobacter ferrooxydans]APZ44369.1 SAM-dependent methyltransferase [Acidihalobacter ferrooxydans]